jgi:ABC-type bacteriocin/lantibiotic exporter with double-glycine peptidase domain
MNVPAPALTPLPGDAPVPHLSSRAWLDALMRAERTDVLVVGAYAVVAGLLALVVPVTVQALVTTAGFGTLLQPIVALTVAVLAFLGFAGLVKVLQYRVVEFLQRRVFASVALELAHRLPRTRAEALDDAHGPELVNRFFDIVGLQKAAATLLLDGLALALQVAVGMVLLAFYHPFLLAFDVVLTLAVAAIVLLLGRRGPASAFEESVAKYEVASWLEEVARHPTAFKGGAGARFAARRADALVGDWLRARAGHFGVLLRQTAAAETLQAVASAALLGLGASLVIERQLTLGQLVAAELVVGAVLATLSKLSKQLESYYDLLASAAKVGHLLELPVERAGGERPASGSRPARLALRSVSFAYDARREVLSDVDLELAPGERVVVTGRNGAGKSTLIDLFFGLRTPAIGAVQLDGADVRELALDQLRGEVALVRGVEVFAGSVHDNVCMGRDGVTAADVREALALAGLSEVVSALPEGVHTRLATGGSPLSFGETRRLMLARAIASRPRALLLDEAFEGIDPEARAAVLDALFAPEAPWTLLAATNLPDVVARGGRHLVVEGGRLQRPEEVRR